MRSSPERHRPVPPVIALLTDFGSKDHYVGVMKGIILSLNREARIVDITHEADPQDVLGAYFILENSYRYFPRGTIFAAIVDPGVGTDREVICARTKDYLFLAPDNGLLGFLQSRREVEDLYAVQNRKLFLSPLSNTFHGRDIFAPVSAHLSLGLDPSRLGPRRTEMTKFSSPKPKVMKEGVIVGEIFSIDRFGNLVTNIPSDRLSTSATIEVRLGKHRIRKFSRTYDEERPGTLLALPGSAGTLEIAVAEGSAARKIRAKVGDVVRVTHTE